MDDFARSPVAERREIMQERATQMNLDFTIVEKDFWVCWTLASVFALGPDHPRMTFKGGTSLSKAYALIERFSEDVDLVTESAYFIARGAADPDDAGLSKTKREDRMRRLDEACAEYIGGRLLPELRAAFATRLGSVDDWNITVDTNDRNSLLFQYPATASTGRDAYIRDIVKLELGWRAKADPSEMRPIASYVAAMPVLSGNCNVMCDVLSPARTFWEKVTALHAESFRSTTSRFFSRHYSDVASMLRTSTGMSASANLEMLDDVRRFKQVYYHAAWARYDLAEPGSLVVVPGSEKLRELENDYRGMRQMFLREPPRFEQVIERLREFEHMVNARRRDVA